MTQETILLTEAEPQEEARVYMDGMDATTLFLLNIVMTLILAIYFIGYEALIAFGLLGAAIGIPAIILMFIDASGFFDWVRANKNPA